MVRTWNIRTSAHGLAEGRAGGLQIVWAYKPSDVNSKTQKIMNKETLLPLIRHILTAAGSFIVAKGIADDGTITEAIGALMTLISIGWMIASKRTKEAK